MEDDNASKDFNKLLEYTREHYKPKDSTESSEQVHSLSKKDPKRPEKISKLALIISSVLFIFTGPALLVPTILYPYLLAIQFFQGDISGPGALLVIANTMLLFIILAIPFFFMSPFMIKSCIKKYPESDRIRVLTNFSGLILGIPTLLCLAFCLSCFGSDGSNHFLLAIAIVSTICLLLPFTLKLFLKNKKVHISDKFMKTIAIIPIILFILAIAIFSIVLKQRLTLK